MERSTLLELERKAQTLLMRLFELTKGNTELMATFGEAIEELGWTDEECDQVEDYAIGQDYITRQSMGNTKIASFSLTTNGRALAKRLILNESGDSSVGNLAVPNDRPWIAIGNPYSGGTIVYDSMTGQSWPPPAKPLSTAAATPQPPITNKVELSKLIRRHYDLGEFKSLCFELQVAYDDLPGETLTNRVEALVEYLERRGRVQELLNLIRQQRPNAT